MHCILMYTAVAALTLQIIGAARIMCPNDPNCVCGGTLAIELNCNIDGQTVRINLLPDIYINIKCENTTSLDYKKLPKWANSINSFKTVSFKDCPLPSSSFSDVLMSLGVSKTMALIFQNAKNLSGYFDRKHFAGLQDLTKLLLSINGVTQLPNNLFMDINKLTWLNIRSNTINLSEELFKPLERLETLEISHNHMTNISSNLFSHLSFLRKLSLWQSNVTWFSKDLFTGVNVLEELDLSSNGLNELPPSIFKPLKKLKKLTLFSNKFTLLPQKLFQHNMKLETVVILNNDVKMKELPKNLFGDLSNLKLVYVQRCGLETIPSDTFANSARITNISLAHNDITKLPESVFNDQINLLELDLSSNNLSQLEPKLFSSLVRLESLNLCYNSLMEISGETFSSLLSLMYLNMAHNNMKSISSYLFRNNKQRMSISLAYNKLNFEETELINDSSMMKLSSPFAHTYNLKLLNLSHNDFKMAFKDWWINGHENLDISYNNIKNLWPDEKVRNNYQNTLKKGMRHVWLSNNPMDCECRNYLFLDEIQNIHAKVVDLQLIECHLWTERTCYMEFSIFISFLIIMSLLYITVIIIFMFYRRQIKYLMKKKCCIYARNYPFIKSDKHNILISYCEKDEEFVLKEVLPVMKCNKALKVHANPINNRSNKDNFLRHLTSCVKDDDEYTTLVIFSSNYLTSKYFHVDIKKIHSEMLKTINTIYVFVDIGPENSIYAFLEEQRDIMTTIVWKESNFWEKFFGILYNIQGKGTYIRNYELLRPTQDTQIKLPSNTSFSQLPEGPNMYNLNTLTYSQV